MLKKYACILTVLIIISNSISYPILNDNEIKKYKGAYNKLESAHIANKYYECIAIVDEIIELCTENLKDNVKNKAVVIKELSDLLAGRGTYNYLIGRYNEALDDYEKALNLDEHNSRAYFWKGLTLQAIGDACIQIAAQNGHQQAKEMILNKAPNR